MSLNTVGVSLCLSDIPLNHYAGEHCCRKVSMVPCDITTLMLWPWREGSFVRMTVKGEPQTN